MPTRPQPSPLPGSTVLAAVRPGSPLPPTPVPDTAGPGSPLPPTPVPDTAGPGSPLPPDPVLHLAGPPAVAGRAPASRPARGRTPGHGASRSAPAA